MNRLVAGTLGTLCVASADTGATVLGALGATALRRALFPVSETLGAILPAWAAWRSLALWEVLTFMHMLGVFTASSGPKERGIMAGIAGGSAGSAGVGRETPARANRRCA